MTTSNKETASGLLLLLLAQCMVGICIVASKVLIHSIAAEIILCIRFGIGALLLLAIHLVSGKQTLNPLKQLSKVDWLFILVQALCAGAFFNLLVLLGLKYTSASTAGIITSALPVFVAVFSIIFLKERLTARITCCIFLTLAGLVIINAHSYQINGNNNLIGSIIILISLLPEATYYILAKIHQNKLPIFLVSFLMNVINVPILLLYLPLSRTALTLTFSLQQILVLILLGAGSAFFYVFWFLGCKKVSGTTAATTTAFMPIATIIIASLALQEHISLLQFTGMVLVVSSILLSVKKTPINE